MFPKLAAVVVGAGAIGIGGVAFAKPEWLGINRETPWTHLAQDHDYASKGASSGQAYYGKFGSKHKYYLVGVVGTDNKPENPNTNKAMWDELFRKWEKDYASAGENKSALGKGFKDTINGGIKVGTTSGTYLNAVCETIYKVETSSITVNGDNNNYKESSVWKYCSGLGEKPKTISEEKEDNGRYKNPLENNQDPIGKEENNRTKLISTTGNNKFWEIRDKEFKGDGYEKIESETDAFFKQAPNTKITIRELCEKAYKSKKSDNVSTDKEPNKDKVIKYCSLSKE